MNLSYSKSYSPFQYTSFDSQVFMLRFALDQKYRRLAHLQISE